MDPVSIIITTHNRPQWLAQAINSALGQTYNPIEVFVIDDGSHYKDAKMIVDDFPNVRYVYQDNQGLGAARNRGMSLSTGKWIQFLDDDDWLAPESIFKKHEVFLLNSNIDVVYSDLYLCNENGKITRRYYKNHSGPLPTGDIFLKIIRHNFIPSHAILWSRDTLEKSGGFPQRSGYEDWECLVKAAMFAKFEYVPLPLGYYRQHSNSMSRKFNVMYSGKISMQRSVVESTRFKELPQNDQIYLLCKYSIQQWVYGEEHLAKGFLEEALLISKVNLLPKITKMWFKIGRWPTRLMIRLFAFIKKL